ncbi:MAG: c-type cytochrome [Betaproteobacteria bacterium]
MSQHHTDPVEENIETHPVKLAIAVTMGAVGLVVGIILLAYFAVGSHRIGENDSQANMPDAVAKRIAPAVMLEVEAAKGGNQPAVPAAASKAAITPVVAMAIPATLPSSTTIAAPTGGEGVYKSACAACHAAGVAGAPKLGDKSGWAARIAKGKPLLYEHALKGFNNVMPAKGGNPALSDADVKAAVDYLVAQVK